MYTSIKLGHYGDGHQISCSEVPSGHEDAHQQTLMHSMRFTPIKVGVGRRGNRPTGWVFHSNGTLLIKSATLHLTVLKIGIVLIDLYTLLPPYVIASCDVCTVYLVTINSS